MVPTACGDLEYLDGTISQATTTTPPPLHSFTQAQASFAFASCIDCFSFLAALLEGEIFRFGPL